MKVVFEEARCLKTKLLGWGSKATMESNFRTELDIYGRYSTLREVMQAELQSQMPPGWLATVDGYVISSKTSGVVTWTVWEFDNGSDWSRHAKDERF